MSEYPLPRDADESPADAARPARSWRDAGATDPAGGAASPDPGYAAVVVTGRDGTEECTIFPLDASETAVVTTWMSAAAGSYVPLARMR
jgi:hypothetical protein